MNGIIIYVYHAILYMHVVLVFIHYCNCFAAVVHSTPSNAAGTLLLQWTPPTLFDGDSLLQYEVTLTPRGVGSAVQVKYTLPATNSELTAQGLQAGEEYEVMIDTRVDLGLVQPFYSMNITIPVTPASSAAVVNGVAGAGVTLLIVLVCVAVVGLLLLLVFLKWRNEESKRKETKKERYMHVYFIATYAILVQWKPWLYRP